MVAQLFLVIFLYIGDSIGQTNGYNGPLIIGIPTGRTLSWQVAKQKFNFIWAGVLIYYRNFITGGRGPGAVEFLDLAFVLMPFHTYPMFLYYE